MIDVNSYVGVPFRNRGRTINGLDCWGLVRLAVRDIRDVYLPSIETYRTASDHERVRELIDLTKPEIEAREVTDPQHGDIVVMAYRGVPCHVGVYLDGGKILHIEAGKNAVVERISTIKKRASVKGFYRVGSD